MKPQTIKSMLSASLLCLLAVTVLPACQKAKMQSVPRAETPDKDDDAVREQDTDRTPRRDVVEEEVEVVVPPKHIPVVRVPTPTDRPNYRPPRDDDDDDSNPHRPVMVYYPTRPRSVPVRTEVAVDYIRDGVVSWFGTFNEACNECEILPVCNGEDCGEKQLDPVVQGGKLTDKIDVLFVVDTSASLVDEMEKIASNIVSFVNALPSGTDLRFAMLIGHGPGASLKGKTDWFGKFWATGDNDPAVIIAGKITDGKGQITKEQLVEWLTVKFKGGEDSDKIPFDSTKNPRVQGEALFANLNEFLSNKFDQSSDFPRSNAALAIMFIADENDVCYDYTRPNLYGEMFTPQFATSETKTGASGITFDAAEFETLTSSVCKSNGIHVDYNLIEDTIRSQYPEEGMPVVVSGIMYLNNEEPKAFDDFSKDNEAGRGYLELIDSFGGEAVSLAGNNYGADLAQLGSLSGFKMEGLENTVPLISDGEQVDPSSITEIRVEIKKVDGEVIQVPRNKFVVGPEDVEIDRNYIQSLNPQEGDEIIVSFKTR